MSEHPEVAQRPGKRITTHAQAVSAATKFAVALRERATERDLAGVFPREEISQFGRTGLLAISVPAEYGGPGLPYAAIADVLRIVAAADASIAQIPQSHFGMVETLRDFGEEDQKAAFLDRILTGDVFGNAQSESGQRRGRTATTRLTKDGGAFLLSGHKKYTTGSYTGDWIRVSATDDSGELVFAIIPRDSRGVEFSGEWDLFGQRGTASMDVTFADVTVPSENVLRRRNDLPRFTPLGTTFQLSHAAIDVGVGRGALDDGKAAILARGRVSPDAFARGIRSAAEEPYVVVRIGELSALQHAAEALLRESAGYLDAATATLDPADVALAAASVGEAKAFGGDTSLRIASEIIAFAGASAALRSQGLDRHWRDVRVHTLHDPNWWKYFHSGNFYLNNVHPPVIRVDAPDTAASASGDAG
jgi:alkylation response protein AidB-like acyl-CoA dehydrogenase